MTYVDTSVIVSYYCPEPRSRQAERMLRRAEAAAISWLVEAEFAATLGAKLRRHELERSLALRIQSELQNHLRQGVFARLPVGQQDFERARVWLAALDLPVRTFDALHLAVAAGRNCDLLTADREMAGAAKALAVRVQLLN